MSTENFDTPFISIEIFATGEVLKHSTEVFAYEIFRHCEINFCRWKILITPLLSLIFFASGSFLKHNTKEFHCEKFGTVRQEGFRRKILIPHTTLLSIFFFVTGNFLEYSTEGFPCQRFRHRQTKKNSTENLDNPRPLIHNLFRNQKFSQTQLTSVPLRNFSAL